MNREGAGQSAAVGDVITACTAVTSSAVQLSTINKAPAEKLDTKGRWMKRLQIEWQVTV